jgi:microcystin-dependent protein
VTVIQPPTFIADGCYEAVSFRHMLAAAANGEPGISQGLDLTGVNGRQLTFSPGSALVPGATIAEGFYQLVVSVAELVTVGPGDATQPRIDIVVARVYSTEMGDPDDEGVIEVVAGTPGSGVPPALPTRSTLVATVTVPAAATSITDANVVLSSERPGAAPVPVAAVIPFAGDVEPDGYLLCAGQQVAIAAYPALYAKLGTKFGSGSGTFGIPDLRGRTVIGSGSGTGLTNRLLAQSGGSENVTLTTSQIPAHSHTVSSDTHSHSITGGFLTGQAGQPLGIVASGFSVANRTSTNTDTHTHTVSGGGSGASHSNMQPFLVMNYIIRAY